MESYNYPVVVEQDDNDTLLVTVPDFPEAVTFGEDAAEAMLRAAQVIELSIEGRIKDHEDIPLPAAAADRPSRYPRWLRPRSPSTAPCARAGPRRPSSAAGSAGTALRLAAYWTLTTTAVSTTWSAR